jgi:hypothetical protein
MAGPIQCDNCGALLTKEDVFCGECGAPQPPPGSVPEQSTGLAATAAPELEPNLSAPVPSAPESDPSSAKTGWRVAVIVLLTLGVIICFIGLVAFLVFGMMEGEDTTPAEDWLFSAICCLLPIGGTGAVLAIVGAVLWNMRLRDR